MILYTISLENDYITFAGYTGTEEAGKKQSFRKSSIKWFYPIKKITNRKYKFRNLYRYFYNEDLTLSNDEIIQNRFFISTIC